MNKALIILSVLAIIFSMSIKAQLPYYTGFDNASQKNGWVEYKTAATSHSHWGYGGAGNSYSAPSSIGHDYSPSTGVGLTDNWYVSPSFSLVNGGVLDSIRYKFSGFSTPEVGDTIGLYLLNGSQDPSLANSKALLFDFRGVDYNADNTYRVKANINLPLLNGLNYLAIRYRNTDCSSKWLTVNFDNIALSGNSSVGVYKHEENRINIYPNPTKGQFTIESKSNITAIKILNTLGDQILEIKKLDDPKVFKINYSKFSKGIHFVQVYNGENVFVKKVVVN